MNKIFILNLIQRKYCQIKIPNIGFYNIKIKQVTSPIIQTRNIILKDDKKLNILTFNSGIGFFLATIQFDDKISIVKYEESYLDTVLDLNCSTLPLISCGRRHCLVYGTFVTSSTPKLISFGNNAFGQCGSSVITQDKSPTYVTFEHSVAQVQCGLDHSMIVTHSKEVFSCGLGTDGQTGLSTLENNVSFTKIKFPNPITKIVKTSSRADTTLALSDDNEVYGWGNNEYGQILTHPQDIQLSTPVDLNISSLGLITDVLAIGSMCFVVINQRQIFGWGYGVINGVRNHWQHPKEIKLVSKEGEVIEEDIEEIVGSVHYGVVKTITGRICIIGNYPGCQIVDSPNELIIPGPVKNVSCDIDKIYFTLF